LNSLAVWEILKLWKSLEGKSHLRCRQMLLGSILLKIVSNVVSNIWDKFGKFFGLKSVFSLVWTVNVK
jgi:hypothetical protein